MTARVALLLAAMLVFLRIAWVNLVAVAGATVALLPLVGRRRPVGIRTATFRRRPAEVIPLEQRRAQQQ
jgi:hypothetical protein